MPLSNFTKRTLSTVILAPLALGIIFIGGIAFQLLIATCGVLMLSEWFRLIEKSSRKYSWGFLGLIYISIPCASLLWLEANPFLGPYTILSTIVTVWAIDIGAYIAGKLIGGPKLAPRISPKKTWAGLVGAMAAAALSTTMLYLYAIMPYSDALANRPHPFILIALVGIVLAIIAQTGDLFESWVKRHFNVKDSGNLIPGHGGLLDRLDGLLFVAPVIAILGILYTYL